MDAEYDMQFFEKVGAAKMLTDSINEISTLLDKGLPPSVPAETEEKWRSLLERYKRLRISNLIDLMDKNPIVVEL